jgi:hypothetical protein
MKIIFVGTVSNAGWTKREFGMSSIPKDGKGYLAWHKEYGMCQVFFNIVYDEFLAYDWRSVQSYEYRIKDMSVITRWMDEKGQWHGVSE